MKARAFAATALAASAIGGMATHALADDYTFDFVGNCATGDCTGQGKGVLKVVNYTLNNTLTVANLQSFTYSSDKLNVDIEQGQFPYGFNSAGGSLSAQSGPQSVSFSGKSVTPTETGPPNFQEIFFSSDKSSGAWNISVDAPADSADMGPSHTWSDASDVSISAAPEPDAWALLIGGVAAMGLALRTSRRRHAGLAGA